MEHLEIDDFPEAPILNWALNPESGLPIPDNQIRFNKLTFESKWCLEFTCTMRNNANFDRRVLRLRDISRKRWTIGACLLH